MSKFLIGERAYHKHSLKTLIGMVHAIKEINNPLGTICMVQLKLDDGRTEWINSIYLEKL